MVALSSCLIWQIISFILPPNEYGCVYDEDVDLGKKVIFSDEAHFDLGGYVNKQNCRVCGQKTRTHTLSTQNESLFGADFGPKA